MSDDPYGDILADPSAGGVGGARRLADSYRQLAAHARHAAAAPLHRAAGHACGSSPGSSSC